MNKEPGRRFETERNRIEKEMKKKKYTVLLFLFTFSDFQRFHKNRHTYSGNIVKISFTNSKTTFHKKKKRITILFDSEKKIRGNIRNVFGDAISPVGCPSGQRNVRSSNKIISVLNGTHGYQIERQDPAQRDNETSNRPELTNNA